MDIKDVMDKLQSSKTYTDWIAINPDHYLAHMFTTMEDSKISNWQIGYYGKESDKITVFDIGDDIRAMPPEEAFKEKNYIEELDLDIINIDLEDAMNIVDKVLKDNYSSEPLVKSIILLQNLPNFGLIWNISIVTSTFKVINVKISAQEGNVIQHTRESLMGWKKE